MHHVSKGKDLRPVQMMVLAAAPLAFTAHLMSDGTFLFLGCGTGHVLVKCCA